MALFEVSGWSIPSAPIHADEAVSGGSKKRKRPSSNPSRLEAAGVNVEKLLSRLSTAHPEAGTSKSRTKAGKAGDIESSKKKRRKPNTTSQEPLSKNDKQLKREGSTSAQVAKQSKQKATPAPNSEASTPALNSKSQAGSLTALQAGMKERLDGARFRLINENLYKSDSHDAHKMMQGDPHVFKEYHAGFRHQVLSWPTNPVDHYITKFTSYPPRTLIADLGCGDAALAKSLGPQGISVLSYDLVSDNKYVIEADICKSIPLPGSEGEPGEKSSGEGQVADVVVCALSLMGTNWVRCLKEAWRILKPSGQLHIAEVTSRFSDVEQFVSVVGSIGFRLRTKDTSNTHFILFEFTKISRLCPSEKEWTKLIARGSLLKPCEYKRR